MHKSRDRKQSIAVGQVGMQEPQDYSYGQGAKSELPGGTQRHEMQGTQSRMAEMQGMNARELPV